jgi:hypoxanthine phosphoribosyltransferase
MKLMEYSWADIESIIDDLVVDVKYLDFTHIYGLPRGGLIPAVLLSHKLDVKLTTDPFFTNKLLVIDDIVDTGHSIKPYISFGCTIVSLHYKEQAIFKPDLYHTKVPNEAWVVYPWENKNAKAIQDYLKK